MANYRYDPVETRERSKKRKAQRLTKKARIEAEERAELARLREKYGNEDRRDVDPPRGYYDDRTARES